MADRPIIELLVAAGTSERAAPLVNRLRKWADPRAPDAALSRPAARLATSCRAPGLDAALTEPSCPVAVWLDEPPDAGPWRDATALITEDPAVASSLGDRAIQVPRRQIDAARHPVLPPFLRDAWRRRFGLPDRYIAGVGVPGAAPVPPDATETALALASAAAVSGPSVLVALALGTPTVTDVDTAASLGAVDGQHLVVATVASAMAVAEELAADADRCAELGRAGRRLAEQRHDVEGAAALLARTLGLLRSGGGAEDRIRTQLDLLATPSPSLPRRRALDAVAALSSAGGGS